MYVVLVTVTLLTKYVAEVFNGDESEEDRPKRAWFEVYRSLRHEVLSKEFAFNEMHAGLIRLGVIAGQLILRIFRCFKRNEESNVTNT